MNMEQPPLGGFPEGYDPNEEAGEILGEDHSLDKREATSKSLERHHNAETLLTDSRNRLMQSLGLLAMSGTIAPPTIYMAGNFQELVATSALSTIPAEALLGAMLAFGAGSTVGGIGGGIAKLIEGIKGMRKGKMDKEQAGQDVRTYSGNEEALR